MLNTHEQLIGKYLNKEIYDFVRSKGYKGEKSNLIVDLLGAFERSSAYLCDPTNIHTNKELTEEEYMKILISEMNLNY